jgi:hypothetical protein
MRPHPNVYLPFPQHPRVYLHLLFTQHPTVHLPFPQHRHSGRSPLTRMATFPQQPIPIIKPHCLRDTSIWAG